MDCCPQVALSSNGDIHGSFIRATRDGGVKNTVPETPKVMPNVDALVFRLFFQISRTSSLASLMFKDDSGMDGQADFKRRHVDGEVRKAAAFRAGRIVCSLVVSSLQRSSSRFHRCKTRLTASMVCAILQSPGLSRSRHPLGACGVCSLPFTSHDTGGTGQQRGQKLAGIQVATPSVSAWP